MYFDGLRTSQHEPEQSINPLLRVYRLERPAISACDAIRRGFNLLPSCLPAPKVDERPGSPLLATTPRGIAS